MKVAKVKSDGILRREPISKSTSIGHGNVKTSSMNKSKRASYKKYRGQG